MSFEPKILSFLCNWCAYAGADLAGISRFQYPPNTRVIRVMCSGRIDPAFVPRAFLAGFRRGDDPRVSSRRLPLPERQCPGRKEDDLFAQTPGRRGNRGGAAHPGLGLRRRGAAFCRAHQPFHRADPFGWVRCPRRKRWKGRCGRFRRPSKARRSAGWRARPPNSWRRRMSTANGRTLSGSGKSWNRPSGMNCAKTAFFAFSKPDR